MASAERSPEPPADDLRERLVEALRGLRFGLIELQVHDSRVVRITRTEKVLIDLPVGKTESKAPSRR